MTPRRLNALRWTTEEKDTVWTARTDTKHRTADKEKAEFPRNSRRWKCAHVDGYKHITETPSCRQITVHAQRPDKIREQLLHLRVWDLGGFLRQAAALCRDQVVVLGADVLVWIVKTAWTGSGRRSGGKKDKNRTIQWSSCSLSSPKELHWAFDYFGISWWPFEISRMFKKWLFFVGCTQLIAGDLVEIMKSDCQTDLKQKPRLANFTWTRKQNCQIKVRHSLQSDFLVQLWPNVLTVIVRAQSSLAEIITGIIWRADPPISIKKKSTQEVRVILSDTQQLPVSRLHLHSWKWHKKTREVFESITYLRFGCKPM